MIKFLLLGLIIYGYYRFVLNPKRIEGKKQEQLKYDEKEEEGEYVDYEEIE